MARLLNSLMPKLGLAAGPALFFLVLLLPAPEGLSPEGQVVLATACLMAVWWVTEALPIYATALVPLVVFPAGGALAARDVSSAYMDSNIVLFLGGFFLAAAVQKWKLHRRIALFVISRVGTGLSRLMLGFMAASAFLSMGVSNTATAIMMLPIAMAVIHTLQESGLEEKRFPSALLLSIAYSCSIGGIATLIGTPPNIVFVSQFSALFPEKEALSFGQWMVFGLPFSLVFLLVAWVYLSRFVGRLGGGRIEAAERLVSKQRERLGRMSGGEIGVATVFVSTALAWIFRRDLDLGVVVLPGWAPALGIDAFVHDSTVAVAAALLLFAVPTKWKRREFLLDWESAVRIPWGILLLFGGGIALARAFQSTGLAEWLGGKLSLLQGVPLPLLILFICLLVSFMTELTSNTATSAIFMPILAGTAGTLDAAPELLMIPAAISASCAFMLPIATPPNAIVFGAGHLSIPQMCRAGFFLNLIGAVLATLTVLLIVKPFLGL